MQVQQVKTHRQVITIPEAYLRPAAFALLRQFHTIQTWSARPSNQLTKEFLEELATENKKLRELLLMDPGIRPDGRPVLMKAVNDWFWTRSRNEIESMMIRQSGPEYIQGLLLDDRRKFLAMLIAEGQLLIDNAPDKFRLSRMAVFSAFDHIRVLSNPFAGLRLQLVNDSRLHRDPSTHSFGDRLALANIEIFRRHFKLEIPEPVSETPPSGYGVAHIGGQN